MLTFTSKVGATSELGNQKISLTPGASSCCTGSGCCCSSCCCW